jgi:PAS domain S-box-containing protein
MNQDEQKKRPRRDKDLRSGDQRSLKSIPAMIHAVNNVGEIVDLSDVWLLEMGYAREEVLGRAVTDFLAPASCSYAVEKGMPEFYDKGSCQNIPCTFVKKSGEMFDVLLSASSERDEDGRFVRSCTVLTDVTEINTLAKERSVSDRLCRQLMKGMLNGFALYEVITDKDGQPVDCRFLQVNPAFEKIIDFTVDQIIGKTLLELLPATELYWIKTFGQVALSRQAVRFENYSAEFDRHFDVHAFSPFERQVAVVVTDITERRQAEMQVSHSEELFRRTFDQSPIGTAMVGLDYRFLKVNQELCRITGYQAEELLALEFVDITFPDDLPLDLQYAKRLVLGEIDFYEMDKRYIRKDGRVIWVRLSARLIRDSEGTPLYFLPMIVEIDDRKRLEEEKDIQLELFGLISEKSDLKKMLDGVFYFFKEHTGADAIALRLSVNSVEATYNSVGFPVQFIAGENVLGNQVHQNRLAALQYIEQHINDDTYDIPFTLFTKGGSFYTNNSRQLFSQRDVLQIPFDIRKHCREVIYESILLVPLRVGDNFLGLIQLYHKNETHFSREYILFMERLAGHTSVAVLQRLAEESLKIKQVELKEMNAALKILIRNREEDLLEHDRGILVNIRQLILPSIERLKLGSLDLQQKSQLNILESNLETISSPFAQKLSSVHSALTPVLIEVADMIKKGLTNKEIARVLGISVKSVETYRKRMRERLNLKNTKVNLRAHLLSIK